MLASCEKCPESYGRYDTEMLSGSINLCYLLYHVLPKIIIQSVQ